MICAHRSRRLSLETFDIWLQTSVCAAGRREQQGAAGSGRGRRERQQGRAFKCTQQAGPQSGWLQHGRNGLIACKWLTQRAPLQPGPRRHEADSEKPTRRNLATVNQDRIRTESGQNTDRIRTEYGQNHDRIRPQSPRIRSAIVPQSLRIQSTFSLQSFRNKSGIDLMTE